MTTTKEKKSTRKPRATAGTRTQKMMTFRVDNELLEHLEQYPNKGRYINELIRADMSKQTKK